MPSSITSCGTGPGVFKFPRSLWADITRVTQQAMGPPIACLQFAYHIHSHI
jgi:hypothetical protein